MSETATARAPAICAWTSATRVAGVSLAGLGGLGAGLGLGAGASAAGYAGLVAGAFICAVAIETRRRWHEIGQRQFSSRDAVLVLVLLVVAVLFCAGGWLSVLAPICFRTLDASGVAEGILAIGGGLAVGAAGIMGALIALRPDLAPTRHE